MNHDGARYCGLPFDPRPPKEESWKRRALCAGTDPELFHPSRGEGEKIAAAKAVCAGCPVRAECLAFGMEERFGVWGGLTEAERRLLRRERGAA